MSRKLGVSSRQGSGRDLPRARRRRSSQPSASGSIGASTRGRDLGRQRDEERSPSPACSSRRSRAASASARSCSTRRARAATQRCRDRPRRQRGRRRPGPVRRSPAWRRRRSVRPPLHPRGRRPQGDGRRPGDDLQARRLGRVPAGLQRAHVGALAPRSSTRLDPTEVRISSLSRRSATSSSAPMASRAARVTAREHLVATIAGERCPRRSRSGPGAVASEGPAHVGADAPTVGAPHQGDARGGTRIRSTRSGMTSTPPMRTSSGANDARAPADASRPAAG